MTRFPACVYLLTAAMAGCTPGASEELIEQFRATTAEIAAESERRDALTVVGLDGWLFFAPELRHLSVGEFWGERAAQVSRARPTAEPDPLPAILDFKRQLDAVGVELLVVPVPPKSVIYPEKITGTVEIPIPVPRLDPAHQAFYELLRQQGIDVLDLTDDLSRRPVSPGGRPLLSAGHALVWCGVHAGRAGDRRSGALAWMVR